MEKNLQSEQALGKFKKLVEQIGVCMFITNNETENEHTRPMYTVEVEEDGTLWFFTDIRSIKVEEVASDRKVHLTYAHPGKDSYLDVRGTAEVVTDKQEIKNRWKAIVKPWFPDGENDPNIGLLRVSPLRSYYWDSETGKMVQFFKMAAAAVTGSPKLANGAEGRLDL